MEEIKFKIKGTESANVEIVPVSDGVEIIVHYGEKKPAFKMHTSDQDTIEDMKAAAREEYKKAGSDKKELKKFVDFYERKINEDGWRGKFDFKKLYERWLENKR